VNGRRSRAWFKLGTWKFRVVMGRTERRRCLIYGEKETEVPLLLIAQKHVAEGRSCGKSGQT